MHQQFRHVDDVRRLCHPGHLNRQDHQMLLVRRRHLHSVCDKENLNLVHQLLVSLDVNQMLVRQLLDVLVVDVQRNLDELNLDADLTLVDVRRIQTDYFRHVVVVALLVKWMQLVLLVRLVRLVRLV
jgi:hypothetical protein